MLRPLAILLLVTLTGLGSVALLPKQIVMQPSAVKLAWPNQAGPDWVKIRDTKPSPQEVAILAKDTDFCKAEYLHVPTNATLDVGIVLSGMDPNNSIHRPERCLVAQGHSDLTRSAKTIPFPDGRTLPVMRLRTRIDREIPTASGAPQRVRVNFVTFYWFVGHSTLTANHYRRTFCDIRDRLLYGSNQRWAYVTVALRLPDTPEARALADGTNPQLDNIASSFLSTVIPRILDSSMLE